MTIDEKFMARCLQLARCGVASASPNPMVGAVIVAADRIIGEGFHRRAGEAHAEVNAFCSVREADESLLPSATMYVSLEPCSHFGKTPPCADLIIRKGIRRVVVGCTDTFSKVNGEGIRRLSDAGIDVSVGVLESECRWINRKFFTFHAKNRPFVTLKWAQTADGFLDKGGQSYAISSPFTQMLVHRLRAEHDAIVVGRVTEEREHPRLDVRHWTGKSPHKYVLSSDFTIDSLFADCRERQYLSLMVEGGRATLQSFIDCNLFDEIRIETAPMEVSCGTPAPQLPEGLRLVSTETFDNRKIEVFSAFEAC